MDNRPQKRVTVDDERSIRAFKEKNKKAKLKKQKIMLIAVASLIFMVLVFVFILVFFRINNITVQGSTKYTQEELLLAGGVSNGSNLLFLNTESTKEKIMNTYSYVDDVIIKKTFPSTIEIEVVTAEICYNFLNGAEPTYASVDGRVLESGAHVEGEFADVKSGVFTVEGGYVKFEDTAENTAFYDIAASLENTDVTKITEIDITNVYQIKMLYDDRIEMELGDALDLEEKINFGLGIFANEGIKENEKGVLDLTFATESNKAYFANSVDEGDDTQEITGEDYSASSSEEGEEEPGEEDEQSSQDDSSSIDENLPQRGDDIPDV